MPRKLETGVLWVIKMKQKNNQTKKLIVSFLIFLISITPVAATQEETTISKNISEQEDSSGIFNNGNGSTTTGSVTSDAWNVNNGGTFNNNSGSTATTGGTSRVYSGGEYYNYGTHTVTSNLDVGDATIAGGTYYNDGTFSYAGTLQINRGVFNNMDNSTGISLTNPGT